MRFAELTQEVKVARSEGVKYVEIGLLLLVKIV